MMVFKPRAAEMPFLDHLEELRWRIIRALLGLVAGTALCWIFIDPIMTEVLLRPVTAANAGLGPDGHPIHLQNLKPFGQVFLYMEVAFVGGFILSIPYTLYQVWAFVAPGLMPRERRYIRWIVFFTSFCFLGGITFAYFLMVPAALKFFTSFGTAEIENNIAVNEYMSFIIAVMLGAGVVFELPMVSWFLSKLGLLTPAFMRKYRRHAIVGILVIAALLTPGTDPVSQLLLGIPLVILYEISIGISAWATKTRTATP
jgi:sec-independent protein translocase protein TatC